MVTEILEKFDLKYTVDRRVISTEIDIGGGEIVPLSFHVKRDLIYIHEATPGNGRAVIGFRVGDSMTESEFENFLDDMINGKTYESVSVVKLTFKSSIDREILTKCINQAVFEALNYMDEDLYNSPIGEGVHFVQFGVSRAVIDLKEAEHTPSSLPIEEGRPEHDGRITRRTDGVLDIEFIR